MTKTGWKVLWGEGDTYLYGAQIRIRNKEDILYSSPLMPPGTAIKTWYAKTNFQAQRTEPALPLLDEERHYHLETHIEVKGRGMAMVRLVFLDIFGDVLEELSVRGAQQDFTCPAGTMDYRMELINAGITALRFHSIEIWERQDDTETESEKGI